MRRAPKKKREKEVNTDHATGHGRQHLDFKQRRRLEKKRNCQKSRVISREKGGYKTATEKLSCAGQTEGKRARHHWGPEKKKGSISQDNELAEKQEEKVKRDTGDNGQ